MAGPCEKTCEEINRIPRIPIVYRMNVNLPVVSVIQTGPTDRNIDIINVTARFFR